MMVSLSSSTFNKSQISHPLSSQDSLLNPGKSAVLLNTESFAVTEFSYWCLEISRNIRCILGLPDDYNLDLESGFFDLGMTSLMVIELQDKIQLQLSNHFVLPSSIIFDYPSIQALARYLSESLAPFPEVQAEEVIDVTPNLEQERATAESTGSFQDDIAIIGMGCRFPGHVTNPQEFWDLLQAGLDATVEIPRDRADLLAHYNENPTSGRFNAGRGGFLEQVDQFDSEFFGIAPREAVKLDPQQRLLLEVGWEAIEHAGISPAQLRQGSTGVYVGLINADYAKLQLQTSDSEQFNAHYGTGVALSGAAGRLSYSGIQIYEVHNRCKQLRG